MSVFLRIVNGVRKVGAGLRPFNESVWPGVRNDLFVAHQSLYEFFARFVAGKRVLDAGCGTGYGADLLSKRGAASVTGVDIDRWTIRYARRHFASATVGFEAGDIQQLRFADATFDVVTSSNALEHLTSPDAFVAESRRVLAPDGVAVVAVPPIFSEADLERHGDIHYHRSNLTLRQWHALFAAGGFTVECYAHQPRSSSIRPEFTSGARSTLTADDFVFDATDLEGLLSRPCITAIFVLVSRAHDHGPI